MSAILGPQDILIKRVGTRQKSGIKIGSFLLLMILLSCSTKRNGLMDNKLPPCPNSPNCVVTLYPEDQKHHMQPLKLKETKNVLATVKKIMLTRERVKLISKKGNRLHFTQTSRIFRFKDDIQFDLDEEQKTLHFRSASQLGRSDFGVNRERMNEVIAELRQELSL